MRVPSFHMCPKFACYSLVRRGQRLACTTCRSFFDLLCELLFDFLLPLGVDIYLLLGFTFLDCSHFLSYHSVIHAIMTQSYWASSGLPFILSPSGLTWPLVFLLMGSYFHFIFLLGILGPFASFGLPHPFY